MCAVGLMPIVALVFIGRSGSLFLSITATGVAVASAIVLGFYASRSVDRSIAILVNAVRRFQFRDSDVSTEGGTVDGFDKLAYGLSRAAERLDSQLSEERNRSAELQLAAQDKTAEVREENTKADQTARAYQARISQLEEELNRYMGLFYDAPVGYHELDSNGLITRINQAELVILGYKEEEMVGRHAAEFTGNQKASREKVTELLAGNLPDGAYERSFVRKDGSSVAVLLEHGLIRNSNAQIVGLRTTVQDLTSRKKTEEDLARERDLLHTLMDTIPDCIYFKDRRSRFTTINKAQADLMGITDSGTAIGKTDSDFFAGEYTREVMADERRILELETPLIGKVEKLTSQTGEVRWLSTTKVPIRDSSGEVSGLVGVSRDITASKLAEAEFEANLEELLTVVSSIAAGDLTSRGREGQDTLGRIATSLNTMLSDFSRMIAQAQEIAHTISASSAQVLTAAEEMAAGAERQEEEITNTSSSVEEMAASMAHVSTRAESWAEAASRALGVAQLGDSAVRNTSNAINRIDDAVRETAQQLEMLARRSTTIAEIMILIDDIAKQTNLLAVNAAIQAAHAGEAGLGFSVVAEEIRKLAERSARATKDVDVILRAVDKEAIAALTAMAKGTEVVSEGINLAERASASLEDISDSVSKFTILMQEIAASSEQQAVAARNMAAAMRTISTIAMETSAGSRETAAVVQATAHLSQQLNSAISQFKIKEEVLSPEC